jgi:hypothetical protein
VKKQIPITQIKDSIRKTLNRMRALFSKKPLDRGRALTMLDVLAWDLSYAFRTLGRDRGFALIAVLILALGIGANIAVFSVVNTILLRSLPFPDAQRLVRIVEKNPTSGESSKTYTADATQDFQQRLIISSSLEMASRCRLRVSWSRKASSRHSA